MYSLFLFKYSVSNYTRAFDQQSQFIIATHSPVLLAIRNGWVNWYSVIIQNPIKACQSSNILYRFNKRSFT